MRTRRLLTASALVVALLTWLLLPRSAAPPSSAPTEPFRPAAPASAPWSVRPAENPLFADEEVQETPGWQSRFERRAFRLRDACDLPLHVRCEAGGCAAVVISPDLDRFGGWLTLLRRHPRFVLQTAARDLGWPDGLSTCGQAVSTLSADGVTASVELPDGNEAWCLPSDPEGRTSWDEAQRALCARAAADLLGRAVDGFDEPSLRLLRFGRD